MSMTPHANLCRRHRRLLAAGRVAGLLALAVALSGCDLLNRLSGNSSPKGTTKNGAPAHVEPPKPAQGATGAKLIELSLAPPLQTADCYVSLRPASGQVPPLLQVTSYLDSRSESFPSVLIRAIVPSGQLRDLVEQPLAAKIFVTRDANGPVWETPDKEPAQIVLKAIDGSRAVGMIQSAKLIDQGTGQQQVVRGRFSGGVR
jgi:hypothetical protein